MKNYIVRFYNEGNQEDDSMTIRAYTLMEAADILRFDHAEIAYSVKSITVQE